MTTLSELEDRIAALEAGYNLLAPAAVRTNELTAVTRASDTYQLATASELEEIWDDITKIKQKLTILLGTSPDAGSGQYVTTSSLSLILRTYDNQRAALSTDISSLEDDIAEIRRKLTILSLQVDPVIAGTCIAVHRSDDDEVTHNDASYTLKKSWRIVRDDTFYFQTIYLRAEMKVTGGGTGYLGMYVDGSKVIELATTSSTYELQSDSWNWSGLSDDTWYLVEFKLKVVGGAVVSNRGLDSVIVKPGASA